MKYSVARNTSYTLGGDLFAKNMNTVQHQANRRVIGAAHHLPGITIIVDILGPGHRFITDSEAPFGRPFTQFAKIISQPVDTAQGLFVGAGTDQK